MLWQKESTDRNALYIDLFQSPPNNSERIEEMYDMVQTSFETYKFCREKSDELAEKYRQIGNRKFAEKKWPESLEWYNRSLCFAENGSKMLGLAYAQRASYFRMIKMYSNCLIDIELAKQHCYPPDSLVALERWKIECMDLMRTNNDYRNTLDPNLDFEVNQNFPSLANVVEIQYNSKYGRHVIAKDDIKVGKTVMVEQSYLGENFYDKYKTCIICLRTNKNFQPCKNCTTALFCPECQNNDLHYIECNFYPGPYANFRGISLLRSILLAKNAFQNVNQLICFVKMMLANKKLPPLSQAQANYSSFFNLSKNQNSEIKAQLICLLHRTLLNQPELAAFFKTKSHKRFLMHLIYHHILIIAHATQTIRYKSSDGKLVIKSHQLSITASYFNHSCVPNVCITHKNGFVTCVTIRPIRKNDQLFVTYIDNIDDIFSCKIDRQEELMTKYNFQCECELCSSNETISMEQLQLDPDYKFIRLMFKTESLAKNLYNHQQIELMKEKCVSFLTKNEWWTWSIEIVYIAKVFCYLIRRSTADLN